MKKLLSVLIAALIAVSLTACTGGAEEKPTDAPATDVPATEAPDTPCPTVADVTVAPTAQSAYSFDVETRKFEDGFLSFTLPEDQSAIAVTNAELVTSYSFSSPSYPENTDNIIYIVSPAAEGSDYSQKTEAQILAEIKLSFDALGVEYSIANVSLETITCCGVDGIIFSYDVSMNGVTLHQMVWSVTTEDMTFNITTTTKEDVDAQRACLDSITIK